MITLLGVKKWISFIVHYRNLSSDANFAAAFLALFFVWADLSSGEAFQQLARFLSAIDWLFGLTSLFAAFLEFSALGTRCELSPPPLNAFHASREARFIMSSLNVGIWALFVRSWMGILSRRAFPVRTLARSFRATWPRCCWLEMVDDWSVNRASRVIHAA